MITFRAFPSPAFSPMVLQLARLAALLTSYFLIQIGHSGLGSLIVQQGAKNEFSDAFLGLLVSVSYVGFVAGNYMTRYLLPRVSYIRTFSICAATIAIWALFLPMLTDEASWAVLRFLHGVFFSTVVVIGEGWLNSSVDNANRSKIYGVYMIVGYVAFGVSQYILLVDDVLGEASFSVIAMFVILSLVPLCLTRTPEPQQSAGDSDDDARLSFVAAYRVAPVSFVGQFCVGLSQGAAWLFVRYAEGVSETAAATSFLAMLFFISGGALQLPIGWLSDRAKDRRGIMTGVYAASVVSAAALYFGEHFSSGILAFLIFLYGAVSVTAFSLNVAYGQDFAGRERATEYAGRLFQAYAAGALIGPVVAGYLMDIFSLAWLFLFCAAAYAAAGVLTATSRLMPRYVPANPEAAQILSPHALPPAADAPVYTELEIGPALPTDWEPEETATETDFVGPQPDEDERGEDDSAADDARAAEAKNGD